MANGADMIWKGQSSAPDKDFNSYPYYKTATWELEYLRDGKGSGGNIHVIYPSKKFCLQHPVEVNSLMKRY